jgi:hypothetical protein
MTVTIRKLQGTQHEYIAYTKSLCGKATYFVHFEDTIWGAVTLHNFIEMLKMFFQQKRVEVRVSEQTLYLKNKGILNLLKGSQQ